MDDGDGRMSGWMMDGGWLDAGVDESAKCTKWAICCHIPFYLFIYFLTAPLVGS